MFAYKTLKSGTDIRGVASEGGSAPINLTDEVVERIAAGFLVWCEKHLDKCAEGLKIAVGHDSRISADRIAAALFRAFTTYGASVYDCGPCLYPVDVHGGFGAAVRLLGADYGEPPPRSSATD